MAASSADEVSFDLTFKKLAESLQVACDHIRNIPENPSTTSSLSPSEFWKIFRETSRLLSQECTKLCLVYSKKPLPSKRESGALVTSLERACLAVLASFNKLPLSRGKTLHNAVRLVVLAMLDAVIRLCTEIDQSGTGQLISTGNVWEKCDMVADLPKDNREAALVIFERNISLVDDALTELEESIENPTDNFHEDLVEALESRNGVNLHQKENCVLSDADRLLLPPSRGLVKAAKAVLKKTTACVSRNSFSEETDPGPMDQLVELTGNTSALVDDLILATYPPLSHTQLATQATNLSSHLKQILGTVQSSYLANENDLNWIQFLSHAVDHNLQKINELL